jgi:predicted nucleic acid-binding protein
VIYIDSSIALAHLLAEPRMTGAAFWDAPLVSSQLLQYEVWNRIHAYGLSGTHREEATALVGRVLLVDLSRLALGRALEPFPMPVRTLDGLHLATIEFLRAQGVSAELATYDNRLLAAARALGLPVAAL